MKDLKYIILEKLRLTKHIQSDTYKFETDEFDLTVILPFDFYFPDIDKNATISFIEKGTNEFNEDVWRFYEYENEGLSDKGRLQVVQLSTMGIKNVFIKGPSNNYRTTTQPLVFNINTHHIGKRLTIRLADYEDTIINESINEKLKLTKYIENIEDIYWFTNNQGIKLPFDLTIPELHNKTITITKIEHSKPLKKDLWKLYDENGNHILTLYDLVLKTLLFNKSKTRKVAILRIFDDELKKQVRNPDSVVVHYKDDIDKILQESINESSEQKTFANMILLNPTEDSVLILRRANYMKKFPGAYGFPGGSVDKKDKDAKSAAIRELKEETGIELSFNEEHKCKKYDTIKNDDGTISEYYITTLETDTDIKLSKEHAAFEWFNENSKKNHKWMPNIFQIIQNIL